jgi:hypothetical protein
MTSARSRPGASRPDGKAMTRCRKIPPHSPPMTNAAEYSTRELAKVSPERNHAKPISTISAPVRLSGRRRQA